MPNSTFTIAAFDHGPISHDTVKSIETTRAGVIRIALADGTLILLTVDNMNMLTIGASSTGYLVDLLGISQMGEIPGFSSKQKSVPLPVRRAIANRGTRIFKRYFGFEDAKLGSESFTLGEKAAVTGWLAFNVMAFYSAFSGSTNALTAVNNVYEYSGGFSAAIGSTMSFVRLIHYQQPATSLSRFRAIPLDSMPESLRLSWK
jgi:hypothetical protein